ncbi:MAG TPA: hypothetical protein VMR81_01315 [Patescibacteria group bacterium]|nr:hypothetical protein [Patescibacteria group bacterium]
MNTIGLIWHQWKKIARSIGNAEARVLFGLLYVLFVWIVALGVKVFSDPLRLKRSKKQTNFVPWDHPCADLNNLHQQY